MREQIDVVITWVDGDAPEHRAKRAEYGGGVVAARDDVGGQVRYSSVGEIFYCVGSILRFAPWVRKIWIITDNQNPHLEEFVERNFPECTTEIEIVDHRTIFEGYEEFLPTFNSISIESLMWRIPGLAERYVYFNDDWFIASPIEPTVWFDGGQAVLSATKFSTLAGRFLRWIKPRKGGHKPFGHKDAMVNAAQRLGADHFWHLSHAPQPLLRSWHEAFFAEHPDLLRDNIRHRFREESQFSYVSLFYIKGGEEGLVKVIKPHGECLFLKPSADKVGYMERKLREADSNPNLLFGCVNSLGETTTEEQELFHHWICKRLSIEF